MKFYQSRWLEPILAFTILPIGLAALVAMNVKVFATKEPAQPPSAPVVDQRALIQQATHLGTMAGNDPTADNLKAIQSALNDLATDPRLKDVLAGAFLLAAYEAIKNKPLAYNSLDQP